MGRRFAVEKMSIEQQDFIFNEIQNGATDREICDAVELNFDVELAHSSLNRWRNAVGEELAERYKEKRFLVTTFVKKLKDSGFEIHDDKYQQIIQNLEEHLLTSERELINENPLKLLIARQDDEKLRIKREELEFKKQMLDFEREKHNKSVDRVQLGADTLHDFIEYGEKDADLLATLSRHLQPFGEFLKKKYAAQN